MADTITPIMIRYGEKKRVKKDATYWYQDKQGNWHWHPGYYKGPKPGTPEKGEAVDHRKDYEGDYGGRKSDRVKERVGPRKEGESKEDYNKRLEVGTKRFSQRKAKTNKRLLE